MSRMLFLNLPVADLDRSVAFFTALGFEFNPQFTDEHTTCMIVSDQCSVMLLEHSRFADFTSRPIAEATAATEVITAVSAESREEVDRLADAALANGGSPSNDPQDHGFMYGRSFQDPDGHLWEVMWMDVSAMPTE